MEGTSVVAGALMWILLALIFFLPAPIVIGIVLLLGILALALAIAVLLLPVAVVAFVVFLIVRGVKKSKQKKAAAKTDESLDKSADQ